MGNRASFSEQLRARIGPKVLELGSEAQVAKLAGIDRSRLNRFVNGKGKLNSDDMDRLFRVLGLKICKMQQEKNR